MTISTEVRKAGPFIGNDSASVFPFAFKVFKAADLIVVRRQDNIGEETTLVLDSDYHVTLNGNQDTTPGGVVTLVAGALASGFTLVVSSELPYLQPTDLTNQGGFYPKVITNALDRLTIFCQQLAEITGRTLKLPITAPTNISAEIPLPNPSELIAWNETGTGLTTVSPQSLVTSIAYGSATADLFAGDGVTTTFPLSTNPASVNNLDVSIDGHSQRPVQEGIGDYSWNGGASITFAEPPPAPSISGDKNVLVRYMQAIPVSDSEALHAQTREALRRSYAEAGHNLVDGSFETGGTLTSTNDVLLLESAGTAYAWAGVYPVGGYDVAPGIDPTLPSSGYVPRTDLVLRPSVMEALRRSYADAGYTLVDGSFEEGGTLAGATDVLLYKANGKAYSGPVGSVAAGTDPTGGIFVDRSKDIVVTFNYVSDVDGNVALGQRVNVREYSEASTSGVLFFTVVPAGTGVADGGKYIDLATSGLQLRQNIKLPCDPMAWGAIGNGDHANADRDTAGLQGAVNYGSTYINDGHYIINTTTTIHNAVKSSSGAKLEYINTTGPCWNVTTAPVAIDLNEYSATILDNGADRANAWSVVFSKVARSNILVNVEPGDQYPTIYGSLTASQKLDLKFGVHITGNSFTCYYKGKLSRASILMESPDCHIVEPAVVWSNERRWAIKLLAASTTIEGIQMVPGEEYGIYSDAADITHTQIIDNYFDGNTRLQSEIPTGHMIYFTGNLRRSMIGSNRFFIPAKRSIHIGGRLESASIIMNNFSNGDSADLGFGDIYIGSHQGSAIIGNSFMRDNLAAKTGAARAQPTQPPITVVASQNGEFDEPMFIMGNSLQGRNFYADSVYPASSAIITKSNHARIHNKNAVVTRYSDGENLKCYKIQPLSQPVLDSLPAGVIYTDSINALGIADASNASGYITTTRVQDVNNMSVINFGKQEIVTNTGRLFLIRTMVSGTWGAWRQI